ncbi:MAG: type 1 glutamine amidotransferase [Thermoleophilia bacterium]
MRKVMVIQHIECEPLGSFSLAGEGSDQHGQSCRASGVTSFDYVRPYAGEAVPKSLDGWDALIILGGPMAVYETESKPYLNDELTLIGKAVAADVPTLGICLGSQLIAAAAGARVYAGPVKELGWNSVELTAAAAADALFSGFPSTLPVFQLHGDTFDLPSGAVRLASSSNYENQAFRLGKHVYGLQFHVEVTADLVHVWVNEYRNYLENGGIDGDIVLANLTQKSEALLPVARQLIERFLE